MRPDRLERPERPASAGAELAAELLREGHAVRMRVTGSSMHPVIAHGDTVTLEPLGPGHAPRFGDLILFRDRHQQIVLHRVVRRMTQRPLRYRSDATRIQTGATAHPRLDEAVDVADVLGRATHLRSTGGKTRSLVSARGQLGLRARALAHLARSAVYYLALRLVPRLVSRPMGYLAEQRTR